MIRLGLDFDNTIINYESLFHKVAVERGLIPQKFPPHKKIIRDFLIEKEIEEEFTLIQAEVYGKRILEAKPTKNFIQSIQNINKRVEFLDIFIVSHKTKNPYKGPKYDLHHAALSWLENNQFFSKSYLNFSEENVFFEISKNDKIKRIEKLNCNYFVDDLPNILEMINPNCKRILYDPYQDFKNENQFLHLKDWEDLYHLIF